MSWELIAIGVVGVLAVAGLVLLLVKMYGGEAKQGAGDKRELDALHRGAERKARADRLRHNQPLDEDTWLARARARLARKRSGRLSDD